MNNINLLTPRWSFEDLQEVLLSLDSKKPINTDTLYKKVPQLFGLGFDDASIREHIKKTASSVTNKEVEEAIMWANKHNITFDLQKRLEFEKKYNPLYLKLIKGKTATPNL